MQLNGPDFLTAFEEKELAALIELQIDQLTEDEQEHIHEIDLAIGE